MLSKIEHDLVFGAMDCVIRADHVIYASSPITTGARWFPHGPTLSESERAEIRTRIIADNCADAVEFARSILLSNPGVTVITPAPLIVKSWSQVDYLAFWTELISTRISAVWFNRDWQYSSGCAVEFTCAVEAKLPLAHVDGSQMSVSQGIQLLHEGAARMESLGIDASVLRTQAAVASGFVA